MQPISVLGQKDRLNVREELLFIDGDWLAPSSCEAFEQRHPATNEVVASLCGADIGAVDLAVKAARHAFDEGTWPKLFARDRKKIVQKVVDAIADNAKELSYLQTLDNGMPLNFSLRSRASAENAADIFDHYAGWIDKINGETFPQFSANIQYLTLRQPVGVAAGIIPWNAPLMMFAMKVAPALACGCTIVLKASELANLCALRLAELINSVGLPKGVLNVITGGPETGRALVSHPGIDKISFTGSQAVGEFILAQSANGMKRVTLELGGKSAAIVLPDCASVEQAASVVMAQCSTFLSGQVCSTTSRALVHKSIYDRFIVAAEQQASGIKLGDPFSLDTTTAALISPKQVQRVMGFIDSAKNENARLVFGGDRPHGQLSTGNFVNPTLFADVDNKMSIAQNEIFGPVLSVIPFETEEEAINIANDSSYGLAGTIYSTNIAKSINIAKAVRTGAIGINGYSVMPNSPAGGVKSSGIGREGGWTTIEAFTEQKTIMINLDVE